MHPLSNFSIEIFNYKCFGDNGSGIFPLKDINIVIGKNNSGKSTVSEIVQLISNHGKSYERTKHGSSQKDFSLKVLQYFYAKDIQQIFTRKSSGGAIPGNHGEFGQKLLDRNKGSVPISVTYGVDWAPKINDMLTFQTNAEQYVRPFKEKFLRTKPWLPRDLKYLNVAAERAVVPEIRAPKLQLTPDGTGVTNLVRAFINNENLPRDEVEVGLLNDLNIIFKGDAHFTEIICQENDREFWEIFLREDGKGDIRLSQSGSSLQSLFIICSSLRLVAKKDNIDWQKTALVIEEPENNLHPSLLRRLLDFLADQQKEKGFTLLITTHSPISIDWASSKENSQVLHVKRTPEGTKCIPAFEYGEFTHILNDLDVRGSDILQANGIIWVEGPSDRVYLNRWIELFSDGALQEGVHYRIMFYGGKILSHFDATAPEDQHNLVQILSINRNAALIMDSDRRWSENRQRRPSPRLNDTKVRMIGEIQDSGGFAWVTAGKEIENYIPNRVWNDLCGEDLRIEDEFDDIPDNPKIKELKKTKVLLSHDIVPHLTREILEEHLDLREQVIELCNYIRKWNGA
jgi:energy-coupling factor transporter ATP-binding protein EcfA2